MIAEINKTHYKLHLEPEKIEALRVLIEDAEKICVVGHNGPDGDAVGSMTGLAGVIRARYPEKGVKLVVPSECPRPLLSTPLVDEILVHYMQDQLLSEEAILEADLIFCMDFQSAHRMGPVLKNTLATATGARVLIDHHLYPELDFFSLAFSYPGLSSTAELSYHLIYALGWADYIDEDVATSLLTGIITDTGCFDYASEYAEVFNATADLIGRGARKVEIVNNNFHSLTPEQYSLKMYALGEKMQLHPEIHTAYFMLTNEELERYNAVDSDTEGFVNAALDIEGIYYSFFIREKVRDLKISFRSIGEYPVNDIATELFGGGGHKNAAGAECPKSIGMGAAAQLILDAIRKRIEKETT